MRDEIDSQNNTIVSLLKTYNSVTADDPVIEMENMDDTDTTIPKPKK